MAGYNFFVLCLAFLYQIIIFILSLSSFPVISKVILCVKSHLQLNPRDNSLALLPPTRVLYILPIQLKNDSIIPFLFSSLAYIQTPREKTKRRKWRATTTVTRNNTMRSLKQQEFSDDHAMHRHQNLIREQADQGHLNIL